MSALSDHIRQEREYVGYGVDHMAETLKISPDEYVAFESGTAEPDAEQLEMIARLCGTSVERLHGAPLQTDPHVTEALAGRNLTAEDVYQVHRFAELLQHLGTAEPEGIR
ncbi:helix-turn-helix transcriptional regulator [Acrocarpospora sp. B8E8]|uniref:helix-turn-helix domain-containing protein n=1 Tax=Acrocarpospora sp. B8E8 TaxID=3153572 RepID=UPI00325D3AD1